MEHLEDLVGRPLDREALNERRRAPPRAHRGGGAATGHRRLPRRRAPPRPEAGDRLELAALVDGHAHRALRGDRRLGRDLHRRRRSARAKPSPTLYLEALRLLEVEPDEAVAFEDSPHGVRAAKAAGIFTVAVPNEVTRELGLDAAGADLLLDSLADLPPDELLSRFATA